MRVAHDGSKVAFLRSTAGDDPVNRLWVLDTASGASRIVADPHGLLAATGDVVGETPAELARRERAREAAGGIVTYDVDAALTAAVFALGGRLFRTDIVSATTVELLAAGAVFDPRLDPTGSRVAYVSGSGLRVVDSHGDRLVVGEDDPQISWGAAEFVAAEEMHRSRGFWWGPGGEHLLAARVDSSPVATWWISSPVDPWVEPRAVRYPKAGTENARVTLTILGLDGSRVDVDWVRGEFEYLCDASWGTQSTSTREPSSPKIVRVTRALSVPAFGYRTECGSTHGSTGELIHQVATGDESTRAASRCSPPGPHQKPRERCISSAATNSAEPHEIC